VLKVDRSFVRDIAHDGDGAAIVEAIIALAQRLRLRVVAEGVEDAAQLGVLTRLACDEIQGYYFSKPLPRAEFIAWCRGRSGPRASLRPRRLDASALALGSQR
jgi:EAL domain-containing protein (putative c-di-GMP-specific phosphodiesterase class I)